MKQLTWADNGKGYHAQMDYSVGVADLLGAAQPAQIWVGRQSSFITPAYCLDDQYLNNQHQLGAETGLPALNQIHF